MICKELKPTLQQIVALLKENTKRKMMKKTFLLLTVIFMGFGFGSNLANKAQSAYEKPIPLSPTLINQPRSAMPQPTPPANTSVAANTRKTTNDALPQKIDDETARSPVYQINSKHCTNHDGDASEGDEFVRHCKAYGNYFLHAAGFDRRVNYGIASTNSKSAFDVMLFPLETEAAAKFVRADLYDQKLGDYLEWRLDDKGKPYAVIVHASFYKNTGSAKTFLNPKNKVAEFVLLRGLAGYEDLKADLPTVNTPFNPDEQARMIAYKFWESKRK